MSESAEDSTLSIYHASEDEAAHTSDTKTCNTIVLESVELSTLNIYDASDYEATHTDGATNTGAMTGGTTPDDTTPGDTADTRDAINDTPHQDAGMASVSCNISTAVPPNCTQHPYCLLQHELGVIGCTYQYTLEQYVGLVSTQQFI
jgi:predicted extracellular nuclease